MLYFTSISNILIYYITILCLMNYRQQRGILISKTKDRIRRIDADTYEVWSQTTPDTKYTLRRTAAGWDCSCPDTIQHYCKHAYALEHRLGMKARADRGMLIHQSKDQVERLASDHYLVRSQSGNGTYEVRDFGHGWMCSCPDHTHTGSRCKHIQAVEFTTGSRRVIAINETTTCRHCHSTDIAKKGVRDGVQRFRCRSCQRHFTYNPGFEGLHSTPEHITLAVEMVYAGLSTRKVARALRSISCKVGHVTVHRWAVHFGDMMESYLDEITPILGEEWRTDEIYVKIRGERKYLFAMIDSDTRYWIARQVATRKGTDDVRPMFRRAKRVAGKIPSKLISDGASNFGEAHRDEYASHMEKDSIHESHIRMAGDINNNQMESFNGNTIRMREKIIRGLKKEDSALLMGLQVYHNHVRTHLGLDNGTPGEAAGIHIQGDNKILTMVRAAATNR